MRRRALIQDLMIVALAIACTASGYYWGKHAADRWYANTLCFHGNTNGVPVKLIPPQKVKAKPPVASVEEPR